MTNILDKKYLTLLILLFFALIPESLGNLDGGDIMKKAFLRDDGDDGYFKTEMTLVDKMQNTRFRLLEIYTKDYGELIKTYLKFIEPPDIEGTTFLSWENEAKDDTQYLYLPALGRARRIVSSQKDLRFVNTDFTYEDMQRRHPDKDEHRFLREENYHGFTCYVVESIPKKGTSQYSKRISWVDMISFVVLRVDFYDKKANKVKKLKVEKLENVSGIWTPMDTAMEDLKSNHQTLMKVLEVEYNQGISDEVFSLRHLEED